MVVDYILRKIVIALQLKTYSKKERNAFLTGLMGQNIIFNIMAVFTSYFMRDVLLVPAAVLTVILFAVPVFDAVTDPFMGVFVDKTKTRWGKCRPWLLVTPALVFLFVMLSFSTGVYQYGEGASMARNVGIVVFATAMYLIWGIVYMAGDIPLWGITSLMTEEESHRKKLQAYARAAAGIGAAFGLLGFPPIATAIGHHIGDERMGFIIAALIFGLLGCGTFQLVGVFCKEKISPPKADINVRENFKMAWQNKPFRQLLISGVLASPRQLLLIVAMPLVSYYFASRDPLMMMVYMALLGGGMFGGMFVAMALVPKLLARFSKKQVYNWSLILDVPPSFILFGLFLLSVSLGVPGGMTNAWILIPAALMFAVKGTCMGLFSVLQTNMISDAVDYEDYTNNRRPDGVFFSGQTFIVKVGNGICLLLYSGLSALVAFSGVNIRILQNMIDSDYAYIPREVMQRGSDFVAHTYYFANHAGEYVGGALTANNLFWFFAVMFFCVSVLPGVGAALAAIPTWKYELTEERHAEVLLALQQRRRQGEEAEEA